MDLKKQLKIPYRLIKNWIYRVTTLKARRDAYNHFPKLEDVKSPYFVVGIPGSLHVVELCLKYVPSDIDIVFISNGLDAWELGWVKEHLNVKSTISIDKLLTHGDVIDMIIDKYQKPFGILDYDCLVFEPSYFYKLQNIDAHSLFTGLFVYENPVSHLKFPHTFLLFLNAKLLLNLKQKYHVTSNHYSLPNISKSIWERLLTIGVTRDNLPEEYKDYFDTLRMLFSLGYADGYGYQLVDELPAVPKITDPVFHVGGVSVTGIPKTKWGTRGAYLWRRVLEEHPDQKLRERYLHQFGDFTAKQLLHMNADLVAKIGNDYFNFVETSVVNK